MKKYKFSCERERLYFHLIPDKHAVNRRRERMVMPCVYASCSHFTILKELPASSSPFLAIPQYNGMLPADMKLTQHVSFSLAALKDVRGNNDQSLDTVSTSDGDTTGLSSGKAAKGTGTSARGRRLLKVREEKRKREYDRLHNYPAWAKSFSLSPFLVDLFCFIAHIVVALAGYYL